MNKVLTQKYFRSRNTAKLAESLLGKFLMRRYRGKTTAYIITEVEAYDGFKDRASHAHRGKTKRNEVMFGHAGYWYVYFTYGIHWLLNIVTGPKDYPAAILIRGVKGINGPARLTKALHIDKTLNGKPASPKTGLWIIDKGFRPKKIKKSPRIGVNYAGPIWSKRHWRFLID